MRRLMKNFWKNQDGFSYTEIIVVLVILVILIGFAVPGQINKINEAKRATDIANAKLIGQAVENIIQNNDRFKDYTTMKLNVSKELATSSESLDDDFINVLIKELVRFDQEKVPFLQYKKGGYDHFSVTIIEGIVYVYADDIDSGEADEELRLYPNFEEKE